METAVGGRRGLEPEETPGKVPIGSMHQRRARVSGFRLPQDEPGRKGERDPDEDVLRQAPPGKGDQQPRDLVDGPEAYEPRIVEQSGSELIGRIYAAPPQCPVPLSGSPATSPT